MRPKSPGWLWDIRRSAEFIIAALGGKPLEEYIADPMLRAAVERSFEIIGEAMNRLARDDPDTAGSITAYQQMIGLRNVLIHGYRDVDNARVFSIARDRLPALLAQVQELLAQAPEDA
jgi:uncharacterized protein with HEPN domain